MRFPVPQCVLGSDDVCEPQARHGHAPDAFVEIGSLTKVLTGTALARLADDGVLGLDDPVERWVGAPRGTGITLRHLVDHTSGLPRLPPGPLDSDPYLNFTDAALRDLLTRLDEVAVAPPGGEEVYSNLGYAVLGAVLSAAAGQMFEDVVRTRVLDPLGLGDGFAVTPPAGRRLVPTGLFGRPRRLWTTDGAVLPAAGMWATPRAVDSLVQQLVVDRALGDPTGSWQRSGRLLWHDGATLNSSVFAGAFTDGGRLVVHRLHGSPERTKRVAVRYLRAARGQR